MLAGEFPIAFAGGAVVYANLAGGDMVFIGGVVNVPAFYLLVTPDIKKLEDLRGKLLGVTRFGASSDFSLRHALRLWGIEPEKDVKILQIGGQPEIFAAMKTGAIHGAPVVAPFEVQGRKAGFTVLTDLSKSGLQYPMVSIVSTRAFIRKDPETVRAFLKAYAEGVQRFSKEKEQAIKVIAKYTKTEDPEALESAHAYARAFIEKIPRPPLKGIELELQEIAKKQPEAKGRKAEDFIDARFVEELEKSGFFKSLQ
jgi:ABC-type nitrate/sulfonate/bicarbonate transport system substrate-binding protein